MPKNHPFHVTGNERNVLSEQNDCLGFEHLYMFSQQELVFYQIINYHKRGSFDLLIHLPLFVNN